VRQARGPIINAAAHPNGGAALKLVCPAFKNAGLRWRRAVERTAVMGRFPTPLGSVLRNPRNDLRVDQSLIRRPELADQQAL
jgi:hypothetical protein